MIEHPGEPHVIGPIEVAADRHAVIAFATMFEPGSEVGQHDKVPHTFPACWLSHPEILAAVANRSATPLHTYQSFSYLKPLVVGRPYWLTASIMEAKRSDLIRIVAAIDDAQGNRVLDMQGELLIGAKGRTSA